MSAFTREDMVDAIATAISDSMDVDWTSRTGAEAVVRNCGVFELYEALVRTRAVIEAERATMVECATMPPEHDIATLDAETKPYVEEYDAVLAEVDAALAKTRGEQ